MMQAFSLLQTAEYLGGELIPQNSIGEYAAVSTDTRAVGKDQLFVALKGERFDAHDFLATAESAGAAALVVEQENISLGVPQIKVGDTTKSLGLIAKMNRQAYSGPLVALTGSCGKTTVKEMLAAVLRCAVAENDEPSADNESCEVLATQGNLNNHIGVPMTLFGLEQATHYAVVEMGASGLGEIAYLSGLAEPTVALVNNVMAAHLEGFGSEKNVAHEKSRIYFGLHDQGCAVINLDETYSVGWLAEIAEKRSDLNVLRFSLLDSDADVFASDVQLGQQGCYRFNLCIDDQSIDVQLKIAGRQSVMNGLAVAACATAMDITLPVIKQGLESFVPVSGRTEPLDGLKGSLVINDSYNANPGSVSAAIDILHDLKQQGLETLLVLGDLAELGAEEDQAYQELAEKVETVALAKVLTVGTASQALTAQLKTVDAQHFYNQNDAITALLKQLNKNTVVLVKGSRSSRMEVVVNAIAANEDDK